MKTEKTAKRNDLLRKNLDSPPRQDMVVVTSRIQELGRKCVKKIMHAVRECGDFRTEDRRSGRVTVRDQEFDFQIDYYDSELNFRADSPDDLQSTRRVLTIMYPDER